MTNKIRITFTVPDDVPASEAAERLAGYFELLDKLHVAMGGSGIYVEVDESECPTTHSYILEEIAKRGLAKND